MMSTLLGKNSHDSKCKILVKTISFANNLFWLHWTLGPIIAKEEFIAFDT